MTYLGKTADTGDHVRATPGFYMRACLAGYPGAIGDCTRPAGHEGRHQDAHYHSWTD